MLFDYLQVFIPLICLLINVTSQVFISRCITVLGLLKSEFLGFVIGLLVFFVFELYIFYNHFISKVSFIGIFITNLITYLLLGYCYFHFINLGETARRIRILRELYNVNEGLSTEELLQRYNAKEIVKKRIDRLLNNGQIIYRDGHYYIANKTMLFIAKTLIIMKLIVLGKRSEFA